MNQNNSVEQQQCNSFNRIVTNQMNQQEQIDHVQLQGHLVSVENEDPNKIESDQERRQQFEGEQESIIIEQHYPDVARTDVGINQNFEAPKYQLYQLHQIIKDIHSIIESETINDEEKEIKIRQIYNELKKKDQDELRNIFNLDAFKLIMKYINNCRSRIEKILLDIIKLVAEHAIQKYVYFVSPDPMFNDIQSSGLFDKIEQMIKNKIEEENEQKKYSVVTEQLIRIHIQIMKGRQSNQEMIDTCAQVINKNINNLLIIINKLKEEDNKEINNEQENEEDEREIKQSSQLIKIISLIEEKDLVYDWKTRIPDQIMKIVKERIYPLIHLNCPPKINCQQCINIPQSPAIIELKSAVFQTLSGVSKNNQEFKNMLVNDHNIILHLIRPLIQFASQTQFKKKTNSQEQHNQQQSESFSSISLITSSLNLLSNIIMDNNNNNICKVVINTPKALHSLISLSGYKINIHFSQENDQQTLSVRHNSRWCLLYIHCSGDASAQTELVNTRYARVLVIAISTASGSGEEQDQEIWSGLFRLSNFLKCLHQGKQNSFPPQPLLVRRSVEQIEEEGGNEEIDSQIINKGKFFGYNIKDDANEAKGIILNYFIEQGNTKKRRYNW